MEKATIQNDSRNCRKLETLVIEFTNIFVDRLKKVNELFTFFGLKVSKPHCH